MLQFCWVKVRFSVPNVHGVIGIPLNGARVSVRVSAGHVGRLGSVARVSARSCWFEVQQIYASCLLSVLYRRQQCRRANLGR